MAKKPSARKKRDPFRRFRRALGARRIGSYKRWLDRDVLGSGRSETHT